MQNVGLFVQASKVNLIYPRAKITETAHSVIQDGGNIAIEIDGNITRCNRTSFQHNHFLAKCMEFWAKSILCW